MSIETTLESREVLVCAMLAVVTATITTLMFINVLFSAPMVA